MNTRIVLALAVITSSVNADSNFGPDIFLRECLAKKTNESTVGMAQCTYKAIEKWDEELNKVYESLMKVLTEKGKEKLQESQGQWIEYREKELLYISEMYNRIDFMGTMYTPMRVMDILSITKARAVELHGYLSTHEISSW